MPVSTTDHLAAQQLCAALATCDDCRGANCYDALLFARYALLGVCDSDMSLVISRLHPYRRQLLASSRHHTAAQQLLR